MALSAQGPSVAAFDGCWCCVAHRDSRLQGMGRETLRTWPRRVVRCVCAPCVFNVCVGRRPPLSAGSARPPLRADSDTRHTALKAEKANTYPVRLNHLNRMVTHAPDKQPRVHTQRTQGAQPDKAIIRFCRYFTARCRFSVLCKTSQVRTLDRGPFWFDRTNLSREARPWGFGAARESCMRRP